MIALLLAATLCLPPGVPPMESLHHMGSDAYEARGLDGQRHMVIARLYGDDGGHQWAIHWLDEVAAVVDDRPLDPQATQWWIDEGAATDDLPIQIQRAPTQSCRWHRRADAM